MLHGLTPRRAICALPLLLATCHLLLATCCLLLATCYLLLAPYSLLLARCSPPGFLLLAIYPSLLSLFYSLLSTFHVLIVLHGSLTTTLDRCF